MVEGCPWGCFAVARAQISLGATFMEVEVYRAQLEFLNGRLDGVPKQRQDWNYFRADGFRDLTRINLEEYERKLRKMRQFSELATRFALFLLLGNILLESPVGACSFVNVEAARVGAISTSKYYWMAAAVVGALVIGVEVYNRWSLLLGITVLLLVFHPGWLLPPTHGPDCQFINVQGSQAVLAVICILLGYQVFRMIRRLRH